MELLIILGSFALRNTFKDHLQNRGLDYLMLCRKVH